MYVDILFPLTNAIPIMFENVTTHYQTLHTWVGHNVTRYHNFNALPHALPYIFSQFSMVWGYLQLVTIKFIKKYVNIFFKKKLTVTSGNALQITPNQRKYTMKCVVTRVVARSSYGNALRYGLSMFAEFEKLLYHSVNSISVRFHKPSHLLLWNLLNK